MLLRLVLTACLAQRALLATFSFEDLTRTVIERVVKQNGGKVNTEGGFKGGYCFGGGDCATVVSKYPLLLLN